MKRIKRLTAKNPSEARGIRKALRAAGIKFEFKSKRRATKKRNPAKKRTRRKSKSTSKRRRR